MKAFFKVFVFSANQVMNDHLFVSPSKVYDASHGGIGGKPPPKYFPTSSVPTSLHTPFFSCKALSIKDLEKVLVLHLGGVGAVGRQWRALGRQEQQ